MESKQQAELIDAARIALSNDQEMAFWTEVEQELNQLDAARTPVVEKRLTAPARNRTL